VSDKVIELVQNNEGVYVAKTEIEKPKKKIKIKCTQESVEDFWDGFDRGMNIVRGFSRLINENKLKT
jgi:hypothetical protein